MVYDGFMMNRSGTINSHGDLPSKNHLDFGMDQVGPFWEVSLGYDVMF